MIHFHYETGFGLEKESSFKKWLVACAASEGFSIGDIAYVFCDDQRLLQINKEYLNHDSFTDIITFDYVMGNTLSADIFISVERVADNAQHYQVTFEKEMCRVMVHGLLHLMGYKDKSEQDGVLMRAKEEEKINMFHVER
ncbi:rRNA maturation RNase YbeY [Maribacter sp. 2307ULW6-5]|uniref:rRNA maturation RNase YbeY n=1 Tax=Maribacter sp. 2307ULW6-5 TaxID=3386275 RepID=UPI0039BC597F